MKRLSISAITLTLLLFSTPAFAQFGEEWDFGVRTGMYIDVGDPFIGFEALTPIAGNFFFNPNVEWVFIDGGDLATLNADVHYDLDLDTDYYVWVGAGLAAIYENLGESEFDIGANALGGIGWRVGSWIPYAQAKILISDVNDEVVGAVGIRF